MTAYERAYDLGPAEALARVLAANELGHPARLRVLNAMVMAGRATTPRELAGMLGEPLGNVAFHGRALEAAGLIRLTETNAIRGAVTFTYAPTSRGRKAHAALLAVLHGSSIAR